MAQWTICWGRGEGAKKVAFNTTVYYNSGSPIWPLLRKETHDKALKLKPGRTLRQKGSGSSSFRTVDIRRSSLTCSFAAQFAWYTSNCCC